MSGGQFNTASGGGASVSGEFASIANGGNSSVSGGNNCDTGAVSNRWKVGLQAVTGCSALSN